MLVVLRSYNFVSAEQAAAFLGVVPIEKRSGTSVRRRFYDEYHYECCN